MVAGSHLYCATLQLCSLKFLDEPAEQAPCMELLAGDDYRL